MITYKLVMLTKHKNQAKKQPKPNNNRLTEERT